MSRTNVTPIQSRFIQAAIATESGIKRLQQTSRAVLQQLLVRNQPAFTFDRPSDSVEERLLIFSLKITMTPVEPLGDLNNPSLWI